LLEQQPFGQLVPSQMHWPFWQRWPAPQGGPKPQPQLPLARQPSALGRLHVAQAPPPAPQLDADGGLH